MITAVVLAGGLGTRLAAVVPHLPKALAPIQGVPFLKLLLVQLEKSQLVTQVIFALGHKAGAIESFLMQERVSYSIDFSIESAPLGTGGALLNALPKTKSNTLLVLNGDSYFDLPLDAFHNFHRSQNADITIACRQVEDTSRYGEIKLDLDLKITGFKEKSPIHRPGWINAGIYLVEKSMLPKAALGQYSLENDFLPIFLEKQIFGYPHKGTFIDIGTPSSYNDAQQILKPWIS